MLMFMTLLSNSSIVSKRTTLYYPLLMHSQFIVIDSKRRRWYQLYQIAIALYQNLLITSNFYYTLLSTVYWDFLNFFNAYICLTKQHYSLAGLEFQKKCSLVKLFYL